MTISIIVPVYNAERLVGKCLDSIMKQTFVDLEIILVNDGSTDKSADVCEEYSKRDERIRVIHKENGGVSSARNIGINMSKGEYIGFIDADDWVEPEMFEKMHHLIKKYQADISMTGYYKEQLDGTILNKSPKRKVELYNSKEAINEMLDANGFRGFLCNKLFSKKLFTNNPFSEDIHFCEDMLFCCEAMLDSKVIVYDNTPYYHYVEHNDNSTSSLFSEKKMTSLIALKEIVKILTGVPNVDVNKYKNYYTHMGISLLMNGINEKKITKFEMNKLKKELAEYKIKDLTDKSVKISCALARVSPKLCYYIWKVA